MPKEGIILPQAFLTYKLFVHVFINKLSKVIIKNKISVSRKLKNTTSPMKGGGIHFVGFHEEK